MEDKEFQSQAMESFMQAAGAKQGEQEAPPAEEVPQQPAPAGALGQGAQ